MFQLPDLSDVQVKSEGCSNKNNKLVKIVDKLNEVSTSLLSRERSFWRLVISMSLLFACIGWCGFSILSFYATEIFSKSGSPFSAAHTSWITSVTKIICSVASFYVLHRFNRYSSYSRNHFLVLDFQ